ncbi:uncharacterized protein LOC117173037 [Belonocnema kinseyi]|uniref:uncharacterized protein LOC117173037 n=1 Tax=Belonocnema kinseyi TaxID=2817044 RepID=UPI00143DDDDC|nr:uncharacterized protein LOC117173037 [Belonocnema kinseyi]
MTDGNTTGLQRHLKRFHLRHYEQIIFNTKQFTRSKSDFVQEEFERMMVEWLAIKYLPFLFFDYEATKQIFSDLNEEAILYKRTAMRDKVLKRYRQMQSNS